MKHIGNLRYSEGAKKNKKRIARGPGSGHGSTATRGDKGQKSRSGATIRPGFEGGQMPINRRLPKFGFFSRFRVAYQIVNISRLQELADEGLLVNETVDADSLFALKVIRSRRIPLKILGEGDLSKSLNVKADKFSLSAKEKIESAGGKVIINE